MATSPQEKTYAEKASYLSSPKGVISSKSKLGAIAPFLPSAVTAIRVVALPLLILAIANGLFLLTDALFIVAVASDGLDGYLARRLNSASRLGLAFDVLADFWFIGGLFLYFGLTGVYPIWIFILIIFMFAQFALTSLLIGVVYDPVGKYLGTLLYGALALTLLFFGQQSVSAFLLLCIVTVSIFSLFFRISHIIRRRTCLPVSE